ncbi:MAG TPA: chemotaxis protein CheX [Bryobacteraceae bacterium]|nr:chemotaxis protein CheX [Bryobacteraceae bacterium]
MESKLSQYTDFAELLHSATQQVFSTMLGMEIEGGAIEPENPPSIPDAGIVAMVGIAGAVSGNVCIRFSNSLACRLASGLLMMECEQVDGDVLDAIAEIANMIVGGLKTDLEDRYGTMGLSLPTVLSAERYIARSPTLGERFTLSFFCVHGDMRDSLTIQMCLITERSNNSYLKELAELHSKLS